MTLQETTTVWTEEVVASLKVLAREHLSVREIADELWIRERVSVTRNAVLGKLHRLGLRHEGRPGPAREGGRPRSKSPRPRGNGFRADQGIRLKGTSLKREPLPAPPIDDAAIPVGQRRQLWELHEGQCRWPVGDPGCEDFFFCGGAAENGGPYCPGHERRAYDGRR